jgi:hypothetical protein
MLALRKMNVVGAANKQLERAVIRPRVPRRKGAISCAHAACSIRGRAAVNSGVSRHS